MKKRKTTELVVCFCLIIGWLCGCNSNSEPTSKDESTHITIESNNNDNESEDMKKSQDDDRVTLTLVEKDFMPSNPDDLEYIEEINSTLSENGIKAKLELLQLPQGSYSEKLDSRITDGNVPDIIWFRDEIDKKYAEQGMLVDLTDYIKDSKIFSVAMEACNKSRIASYPYLLRIRYNTPKIAVVRKDWLDELELSVPETVQDYYNVLKAFANSDFDHNGKKDAYGITVTGDTDRLDDIFNAAFSMPTTWIKDENGKYIYSKVSWCEKEKLAFYRKLVEEKILDPEYAITKWDSMEEKLYTGKVGMVIGSAGKVIEIYNTKLKNVGVETDLIPLDPPIGNSGNGLAPVDVTREDRGFGISAQCEQIDLAFRVLEFMASDEGQLLDRLGIEGREYTTDDNGNITRTRKGEEWYARFFDVPSWESPVPLLSDIAQESLDITDKYYTEDINFEIPKEYGTKWDEMDNLYKEYSYKIINGEIGIEKFDEFVEKWYKAGGEEITELAQEKLE
ncbi:extracellular solute-binding protein [Vallitalea sediminicola]